MAQAKAKAKDIIRRCVFRPFRKGSGPVFTLTMWASGRYDERGQEYVGYRLVQREAGRTTVLFEAEDYSPSPMFAIDSDGSVEGLMGFLTLRPGDTDSEYFNNYSPAQMVYCQLHAESLSCEVQARFCDENGNVREALISR